MPNRRRRRPETLDSSLRGQWLGRYAGPAPGLIVLNLDDLGTHYEGTAFITPDPIPNSAPGAPPIFVPTTVAIIQTPDRSTQFSFENLELAAVNPTNLRIDTVENVRPLAPGIDLPKFAEVRGQLSAEGLVISWKTEFGLQASTTLPKNRIALPSDYSPLRLDWKGFKRHFSRHHDGRYIFRGQNTTVRLCTAFHRSGRTDLTRFLAEDIPTLHRRLSARTRHVFRLEIPDENGAFFNLVQHHGYPTPLLDWTQSPYVAAFFAYRGITSGRARQAKRGERVRVFVFDSKQWHSDYKKVFFINGPYPHFSIAEFMAIDNERMIPQQAVSSATNIEDIESYIRSGETNGRTYLSVIDLPVSERDLVMRDLGVMGITAGSLFPGLDGACEELKERFFRN